MRALAEFIMRGRVQAATVALLGSWVPLVSPATVALVTLRRGAGDGTQVLLWAMLPALVTLVASSMGPMMALATVAGLLAVFIAALMLRHDASWPRALMGLVALGSAGALALLLVVPEPGEALQNALDTMFPDPQSGEPLTAPGDTLVVGLVAYVVTLNGVICLILGRWWQALLYNPGGFRAEFHNLRLPPLVALVCMGATLYCLWQGRAYYAWSSVFSLPLLLAGVAIVHSTVYRLKMGIQWLVLFYLALVLINPLSLLINILAFIDTWVDFRGRLPSRPPEE